MSRSEGPLQPGSRGDPVSRRTAVREFVGNAVVLAIPVGAVLVTANPIPDPPRRKMLNAASPVDLSTEQQEVEKERRRSDKKPREEKNRRGNEQPAGTEPQAVPQNEDEQPSDAEQRDSRP
jgi:hypothetical protein